MFRRFFIIKSLYFDSVYGIFIAYLFYCIKMPNKRSRRDTYIQVKNKLEACKNLQDEMQPAQTEDGTDVFIFWHNSNQNKLKNQL